MKQILILLLLFMTACSRNDVKSTISFSIPEEVINKNKVYASTLPSLDFLTEAGFNKYHYSCTSDKVNCYCTKVANEGLTDHYCGLFNCSMNSYLCDREDFCNDRPTNADDPRCKKHWGIEPTPEPPAPILEDSDFDYSLNPATLSEFNCFAIGIVYPEKKETNSVCESYNDTETIRTEISNFYFGYKINESIELEVEAGKNRQLIIFGLYSNECNSFDLGDKSNHSEPHILSSKTLNLEPGPQTVTMKIDFDEYETVKVKKCEL